MLLCGVLLTIIAGTISVSQFLAWRMSRSVNNLQRLHKSSAKIIASANCWIFWKQFRAELNNLIEYYRKSLAHMVSEIFYTKITNNFEPQKCIGNIVYFVPIISLYFASMGNRCKKSL